MHTTPRTFLTPGTSESGGTVKATTGLDPQTATMEQCQDALRLLMPSLQTLYPNILGTNIADDYLTLEFSNAGAANHHQAKLEIYDFITQTLKGQTRTGKYGNGPDGKGDSKEQHGAKGFYTPIRCVYEGSPAAIAEKLNGLATLLDTKMPSKTPSASFMATLHSLQNPAIVRE